MLADEFFLVAWDTTGSGRPRLHGHGVALGLAGALIGELVMDNRVAVRGAHLNPVDRRQVGESVSDRVITDMLASPQHTDVRTWLAYLAQRSVDDVSGRLLNAGFLRKEAPKLLKSRQSRYFSEDFGRAVWPATRLRMALVRGQPMTPSDMALIALVDACGMTDIVVDDPAERRTAHRYLTTVLAAMPPPLSDLAKHLGAAVGDAVLTYRT
ncbi:GOLPH3/VPS74 family protein [Nonomuraea sediminis]|uniref:GOLPH3/VPS74 family protein n=1 Tax=Nonomuraea sediminis TaxID=2835864 RepID=UPI001BDCD74C|nr:GPP34 family phosphoprotein [Nonomuraea sediminis]